MVDIGGGVGGGGGENGKKKGKKSLNFAARKKLLVWKSNWSIKNKG